MEQEFKRLVEIMRKLRSPEGCPWDREQNLYSIKEYLIEETFELVEALDNKDIPNIREELGDILLHVVFHSVMAEEENLFNIKDVIKEINDKLVRRHPHVFSDTVADTSEEVEKNWDEIKKTEKVTESKSVLKNVPKGLPSIAKSRKLQERARKVGFDWNSADDCMSKVLEEFDEFKEAVKTGNKKDITHEMGDVMFAMINVSRFLDVNTDEALRLANERFINRFTYIEDRLFERGLSHEDATLEEMEALWQEAKKNNL